VDWLKQYMRKMKVLRKAAQSYMESLMKEPLLGLGAITIQCIVCFYVNTLKQTHTHTHETAGNFQ